VPIQKTQINHRQNGLNLPVHKHCTASDKTG